MCAGTNALALDGSTRHGYVTGRRGLALVTSA